MGAADNRFAINLEVQFVQMRLTVLSATEKLHVTVSVLPFEVLGVMSPWLMTNHRRRWPGGQLLPKLGTLRENCERFASLRPKLSCSGLLPKLCPSQGISPRELLPKVPGSERVLSLRPSQGFLKAPSAAILALRARLYK